MTLFDHFFVVLFTIVIPGIGFIGFRRLKARVAAGEPINRGQMYLNTTMTQWLLLAIVFLGWLLLARPWSAIGFSLTVNRNFIIGLLLVLAAIVYLLLKIRQVRSMDATDFANLQKSFAPVALMMPQNGNELARFYGLSLTAGIVEEILWRGFMFWYLGQFMPLAAVALVSTVMFALAHLYQGWSQLPGIMLVAGAFAGLYILTGSVWLPIVLHIAVDVLQGRLAYAVSQRSQFRDRDLEGNDALHLS